MFRWRLTTMQKELQNLLDHFPEFRGRILELFSRNEDFKSLCFDYWQCRSAMLKIREHVEYDLQQETEYINLCKELENEALKFLIRAD